MFGRLVIHRFSRDKDNLVTQSSFVEGVTRLFRENLFLINHHSLQTPANHPSMICFVVCLCLVGRENGVGRAVWRNRDLVSSLGSDLYFTTRLETRESISYPTLSLSSLGWHNNNQRIQPREERKGMVGLWLSLNVFGRPATAQP